MAAATPRLRVRGLRVGVASDPERRTGVTVLRFESAARTVVDVRGGASATYDTASLSLEATYGGRWAVFLAGGSVFGLDAARGIRDRILSEGGGHRAFERGRAIAPISGACLYDLPPEGTPIADYTELGGRATEHAGSTIPVGRVGAGTGATVGKYLGRGHSAPGGQGFAQGEVRGLGRIAVIVAVNSVGAVWDPQAAGWAQGARVQGRLVPPPEGVRPAKRTTAAPRGTNLVAVATDASIDRPGLQRVATLASAGLARCIIPSHTATDGDITFATSTARTAANEPRYPGEIGDTLGRLSGKLVVSAVLSAVRG